MSRGVLGLWHSASDKAGDSSSSKAMGRLVKWRRPLPAGCLSYRSGNNSPSAARQHVKPSPKVWPQIPGKLLGRLPWLWGGVTDDVGAAEGQDEGDTLLAYRNLKATCLLALSSFFFS